MYKVNVIGPVITHQYVEWFIFPFDDGVCFFIVIIQKMYESDSIKDESIQLLREQATRLKMQNKEI